MPSRPPSLKQRPRIKRAPGNWKHNGTRQERGYGQAHVRMRERVLIEEPVCRMCLAEGRANPTEIADHIIPMSEGGSSERDNYQGLCREHDKAKTAHEAARARKRRAS